MIPLNSNDIFRETKSARQSSRRSPAQSGSPNGVSPGPPAQIKPDHDYQYACQCQDRIKCARGDRIAALIARAAIIGIREGDETQQGKQKHHHDTDCDHCRSSLHFQTNLSRMREPSTVTVSSSGRASLPFNSSAKAPGYAHTHSFAGVDSPS